MADPAPVIVIGAGRSGTNLLRDIITTFAGFDTWPCDEINYIWRHGNRSAPTDELVPDDARPEVVAFIRHQFAKQRRRQGGGTVVEKTCANSLRVGFVEKVVPGARYVYISRDGRDVVASAMDRWVAELDVAYIARKARFVPVRDLPYYGWRYIASRAHRIRSPDRRLSIWGPRFVAPDDLIRDGSLAEICAYQWRRCSQLAERDLERIPADRVHRIEYEKLVSDGTAEVARLSDFMGAPAPSAASLPRLRADSVGKWRTLEKAEKAAISSAVAHVEARQTPDDVG